MAVNMTESLLEQLKSDPELARVADDEGWTFLHQLALAGAATHVDLLLKHGADPKARTGGGASPPNRTRRSAKVVVLRGGPLLVNTSDGLCHRL